ncbi:DoxX family protein [Alcaligenaceae bacterium]|nr:DoxX family protein [Alcaligenaceae bacterium]
MSTSTLDDLGKLVLRLTVGILLLFHGIAKLRYGISGIESMVVARGLPAFFSWAVYIGEVVAPLMLIVGLYTRVAGLIVAINMLFAIALAHTGHLGQFGNTGGWRLELQGMYLFGGLAIAMLGAGRYAIGNRFN